MKYRRGCVWRVLLAEGVFGHKMARDSVWNILINNKGEQSNYLLSWQMHLGLKDTNVEGDLVVEHFNLVFKVSYI